MTVSTYLEAFLSVYGWAVYRVFFLLLLATGLFLYPILRALITIVTEYLSGEGYDGTGYIKQAIATVVLTMAVFFLAMVPVVQITFGKTAVRDICGDAQTSVTSMNEFNGETGKRFFSISEARVPLLPWLAMRLGQGVNAVINKQLPCVMHTADANKTVLSVQTGDEKLDSEFVAFINQCHRPAIEKINMIREGRYDQKQQDNGKAQEWFNKELLAYADKTFGKDRDWKKVWIGRKDRKELKESDVDLLINFVDSQFIYDYIYSPNSPLKTEPVVKGILDGIPDTMKAQSAVDGFLGKNNDAMPSCAAWWKDGEGAKKGLRMRLVEALKDDAVLKAASNSSIKIPECQYDDDPTGLTGIVEMKDKAACLSIIRDKVASGDDDKLTRAILATYQGTAAHQDEGLLTPEENAGTLLGLLGMLGAMAVPMLRGFGVNLIGGALSTVTTFYVSIFMLKLMLRILIPMIIMTLYISWGIYMLIGELRGSVIVKGMITIFSATIIFGLWAIADHIDDKLWNAMYGGFFGGNTLAMILLDAVSGIFYFVIFSVVFYMINLADGGDVGRAIGGGQQQARGLSETFGGRFSGGAGKFGKAFGKWFFGGSRDKAGKLVSGGYGAKAWNGIKARWNRLRAK